MYKTNGKNKINKHYKYWNIQASSRLLTSTRFKAIFTLADIEDSLLFAELRRRGYTGELRFSKVITV